MQTHVKAICDLPTIKSKSSTSLRQFSDALNNHLSAMTRRIGAVIIAYYKYKIGRRYSQ